MNHIITKDIKRARRHVCISRSSVTEMKRRAHRSHRRAVNQKLQSLACGEEVDINPSYYLTGWDIS